MKEIDNIDFEKGFNFDKAFKINDINNKIKTEKSSKKCGAIIYCYNNVDFEILIQILKTYSIEYEINT
jgi:hypothetical protein